MGLFYEANVRNSVNENKWQGCSVKDAFCYQNDNFPCIKMSTNIMTPIPPIINSQYCILIKNKEWSALNIISRPVCNWLKFVC